MKNSFKLYLLICIVSGVTIITELTLTTYIHVVNYCVLFTCTYVYTNTTAHVCHFIWMGDNHVDTSDKIVITHCKYRLVNQNWINLNIKIIPEKFTFLYKLKEVLKVQAKNIYWENYFAKLEPMSLNRTSTWFQQKVFRRSCWVFKKYFQMYNWTTNK